MKSIRFFLSIVILSTITLMAFLSALNGYQDSMNKAEELFDSELVDKAHLLSIAYSASVNNQTFSSKLLKSSESLDNQVKEVFFAFQIWKNDKLLLRSPQAPQAAIAYFEQGFQDRNFLNHRWRAYSYYNDESQLWIMTAERIDIRYVLAENIVLETILPVVMMLPFLGILIWTIISYGLHPLRRLAEDLGNKRADDLTPLKIENQPIELVQVVNSTNDLFKRLEASFVREKRFASDAAHELRTPISAIKIHLHNLSNLMSSNNKSTEDYIAAKNSFLQLQSSVDRMGHLVEQILNLNRTSTEQFTASFSQIDLLNLAQDAIVKEYEYFENKQQKIELEGDQAFIKGDRFALEVLLQNLLSNACKYTPEGGSIVLKIKLEKEKTVLFVEDSGPGVPEDQYQRLFDRFYRLDGDCHASGVIGCGLGLSIVQQIVDFHHAQISLGRSRFSSGLAVKVTFSREDLK